MGPEHGRSLEPARWSRSHRGVLVSWGHKQTEQTGGSSSLPPPKTHQWGPSWGVKECGALARLCPAEQEAGMSWGDRAGDKRAKMLPASCLPVPPAGAWGQRRCCWVCPVFTGAESIFLLPVCPSLAVRRARVPSSERAWWGHGAPLALGWARCLPAPPPLGLSPPSPEPSRQFRIPLPLAHGFIREQLLNAPLSTG